MLTEIVNFQGMQVITDKGISLGYVDDVIVDLETNDIYEFLITETNPDLVEDGVNVGVPYRWVQSISGSGIVLLKYFPGRITRKNEITMPGVIEDGRKRKLRVVKKGHGDGGVGRTGWR